jgi:hypothetical protein
MAFAGSTVWEVRSTLVPGGTNWTLGFYVIGSVTAGTGREPVRD